MNPCVLLTPVLQRLAPARVCEQTKTSLLAAPQQTSRAAALASVRLLTNIATGISRKRDFIIPTSQERRYAKETLQSVVILDYKMRHHFVGNVKALQNMHAGFGRTSFLVS